MGRFVEGILILSMNYEFSAKYSQPVLKKDQPDDTFKFQPLPEPTGKYPYRLALENILPDVNSRKIVFHIVGDTGSIRDISFHHLVAGELIKHFQQNPEEKPMFLYHLGDVVYNHGEASHYYDQFFSGYQHYPAPIFAIAGNHDSDINPDAPPYKSLEGFMKVFCDTTSRPISFSKETNFKSMIQPNVYWTLQCPLANIIGLHSNVPKFGVVTPAQQEWFREELIEANRQRPGKALLVCIHHAPYSADINHGASQPMIEVLESAFESTGVKPDIVFSGHVHNYQRFHKTYKDGKVVPFIVAGAGGYDVLHPVAHTSDDRFTGDSPLFQGVRLMEYCDDKHGFLKVTIEKQAQRLKLTGEYFTIQPDAGKGEGVVSSIDDRFELVL